MYSFHQTTLRKNGSSYDTIASTNLLPTKGLLLLRPDCACSDIRSDTACRIRCLQTSSVGETLRIAGGTTKRSIGTFKGNAGKIGATVERSRFDGGYAGGYDDARQAGAASERAQADAGYAVGYGDARQAGAARERTTTNTRTACYNNCSKCWWY